MLFFLISLSLTKLLDMTKLLDGSDNPILRHLALRFSVIFILSSSVLILMIALVLLFGLRSRIFLWKKKLVNYKVSSHGVSINTDFYKWDGFNHFLTSDDTHKSSVHFFKAMKDVYSDMTRRPVNTNFIANNDLFISLVRDKTGLRGDILLVFEDLSKYQRVIEILEKHLPRSPYLQNTSYKQT